MAPRAPRPQHIRRAGRYTRHARELERGTGELGRAAGCAASNAFGFTRASSSTKASAADAYAEAFARRDP
jgi:hypothetical protein